MILSFIRCPHAGLHLKWVQDNNMWRGRARVRLPDRRVGGQASVWPRSEAR